MTEFLDKTNSKAEFDPLTHLRAENPFVSDSDFTKRFTTLFTQLRDDPEQRHDIALALTDEIKHSSNSEERTKSLWLAHELFPEDLHYMAQLRALLNKEGNNDRLSLILSIRLAKESHDERTVFDLATTALKQSKYELCLSVIQYARNAFDDFDDRRYTSLEITCLRKLGKLEDALDLATTAVQKYPEERIFLVQKTNILISQKKVAEALKIMDEANENDEALLWQKAKIYSESGDMLSYKKTLLKLMNLHPEPIYEYALAFIAATQKATTLEMYEKSILDNFRLFFGENEYQKMENGAVKFGWWSEPSDSLKNSGSFRNSVWSGLYALPADSGALQMYRS